MLYTRYPADGFGDGDRERVSKLHGDCVAKDPGAQLRGRSKRDQPRLEDRDAIAQPLSLRQPVRIEEHGRPIPDELTDLADRIRAADDLDASDWRRANPRFAPDNLAANLPLADVLRELADEKGCAPAQLALAWVVGHDGVVAIPGTRSVARLEENVAARELVLDSAEVMRLEAAFPADAAAGTRYTVGGLRSVNR